MIVKNDTDGTLAEMTNRQVGYGYELMDAAVDCSEIQQDAKPDAPLSGCFVPIRSIFSAPSVIRGDERRLLFQNLVIFRPFIPYSFPDCVIFSSRIALTSVYCFYVICD